MSVWDNDFFVCIYKRCWDEANSEGACDGYFYVIWVWIFFAGAKVIIIGVFKGIRAIIVMEKYIFVTFIWNCTNVFGS